MDASQDDGNHITVTDSVRMVFNGRGLSGTANLEHTQYACSTSLSSSLSFFVFLVFFAFLHFHLFCLFRASSHGQRRRLTRFENSGANTPCCASVKLCRLTSSVQRHIVKQTPQIIHCLSMIMRFMMRHLMSLPSSVACVAFSCARIFVMRPPQCCNIT